MKNNRMVWLIVVLVVFMTVAITIGTNTGSSQENCQTRTTPTPAGPWSDLSKYAVVDYDAPEMTTAPEREMRTIKNNRYDSSLPVLKYADPDTAMIGGSDIEAEPPALPVAESRLVVIGEVQEEKAFLSNEKKGIYTEYSVQIDTILKKDDKKNLHKNDIITIDRAGGVVRYPSGQKILYLLDWQNMPEVNGRYLFLLINEDTANPNYKILTAYQLKNGLVTALDNLSDFREFNGKSETDFIKLVLSSRGSQAGIQI